MIRPATIHDVPRIQEIVNSHAELGKMLFKSYAQLYESLRDFAVYELDGGQQGAGEVVGCTALAIIWADLAEVRSLAVDENYTGRGIGRRLVEWLLESAVTAGMASVHLELRADNEAARRFYRALGFSETVLMPRYYNGREAAMRMIRMLRAPGPLPLSWHPPVLGQK